MGASGGAAGAGTPGCLSDDDVGTSICTIDPQRGQATIVPTKDSSVTLRRPRQLTHSTTKGTVKDYLPPASAIMLATSVVTKEAGSA